MFAKLGQFVVGLGPLRVLLYSAVVVMIVLRPAPGTEAVYEGWLVFPTLLFPALTPIIFMVLLLDALMSTVYLHAHQGSERQRLKRAQLSNLLLALTLLLFWMPYFNNLLQS